MSITLLGVFPAFFICMLNLEPNNLSFFFLMYILSGSSSAMVNKLLEFFDKPKQEYHRKNPEINLYTMEVYPSINAKRKKCFN